jgi:hypothetical protein
VPVRVKSSFRRPELDDGRAVSIAQMTQDLFTLFVISVPLFVVLIEIYKPIQMQQSVLIVNVPGYDETFSGALILLRSSILG